MNREPLNPFSTQKNPEARIESPKNQFPDFQSLAGFGFSSGDCSPATIDFPLKITHQTAHA
jgi:hypothetical protein